MPDQLQLDFKPRGISMMTVEQYSALSPEERKALTFEEMNEVFNRDEWCKRFLRKHGGKTGEDLKAEGK